MKVSFCKTTISYAILIVLILVTAVYVMIAGQGTPRLLLFQREALNLQHGWYYYDSNRVRTPVKHLPAKIPEKDGAAAIFIDTRDLPKNMPPGDKFDKFLCVYAYHQDVVVRLDGNVIYHSETETNPSWIRSYRGMYHLVQLPPDYMLSRTIMIETKAHIKSTAGKFEPIQLSGRSHLMQTIMIEQHFQSMLGVFLLISALFLFGTSRVFSSFVQNDNSLLSLAVLAICLGLWQLEDSRILQFVFGYQPLHWCLEYLTVLAMPIFTFLFLYHIDENKNSIAMRILSVLVVAIPAMQLLFQVTGRVHISDSIYVSHFLYLYCSIHILNCLLKRRHTILNMILVAAFSSSVGIFIFMIITLLFFELFFGTVMSIGILITFGAMILLTYNRVLLRAQETSKNAVYKELAFTDIATGVLNKTAWYTLIDNYKVDADLENQSPVEFTIVLFDMNNLKKTNDTYGHLAGDEMIKAFALAVKTSFSGVGEVYRIGGDEFVAVCKGAEREKVDEALEAFDEAVATQPPSEHPFGAAYGVTVFVPFSRKDFEDAITKADTQMYENKVAMKANRKD